MKGEAVVEAFAVLFDVAGRERPILGALGKADEVGDGFRCFFFKGLAGEFWPIVGYTMTAVGPVGTGSGLAAAVAPGASGRSAGGADWANAVAVESRAMNMVEMIRRVMRGILINGTGDRLVEMLGWGKFQGRKFGKCRIAVVQTSVTHLTGSGS